MANPSVCLSSETCVHPLSGFNFSGIFLHHIVAWPSGNSPTKNHEDRPRGSPRIQYQIAVLTYKVLCGTAPRYLGPLTRVADVPGRRSLRSVDTNRLVVSPVKRSTVSSRAFPVAASQTWNSLPEDVTSASTLRSFQQRL